MKRLIAIPALMLLLALMLTPAPAKADTIYLTDNSNANGDVVYLSDIFQLTATFGEPGRFKAQVYQIKRELVKKVEINDNKTNRGAPPPGIDKYRIPGDKSLTFPERPKVLPEQSGPVIPPPGPGGDAPPGDTPPTPTLPTQKPGTVQKQSDFTNLSSTPRNNPEADKAREPAPDVVSLNEYDAKAGKMVTKSGKLVMIDGEKIVLDNESTPISRTNVLHITVGH